MTVKWWHYLKVSAYWGARAASASEAAREIIDFGARLSALDPLFSNLRGLRKSGVDLMHQQLEAGEPSEAEAEQLFAKLQKQTFFLDSVSADDLAAELAAQAAGENAGGIAMDFNARPSGARYTLSIGTTHLASEPTPNGVSVEIPFADPRVTNTDLLASLLDACIEAWTPRTCGIYGIWHDPDRQYQGRSVYWLHWRAAGVTPDTWTDAKGNPVSRCWPETAPDSGRPHLGGTLDIYPRHQPDVLARWVSEGRRPD